jgi:hypothetical protein
MNTSREERKRKREILILRESCITMRQELSDSLLDLGSR